MFKRMSVLLLCMMTLWLLAACERHAPEPETTATFATVTEPATAPTAPQESESATDAATEPVTEAPKNQEEIDRMNAMLSASYEGHLLPIGGWATPASALRDGYTGTEGTYDKAYQLLADAGLNYMITLEEWSSGSWPLESLSSAKKAGMTLWYNCAGMDPAYSMEKINALLASPDADALGAIYAKDEPTFDGIGETAQAMSAIRDGLGDKKLPVLANLLPTYAQYDWIGGNYRTYVRTYLETAKPDWLMFDFYPYQGISGDQIHTMVANIAIAKEEADRVGIPLYTFLQSSGQPTMREPSIPELRMNAHINLALGVKGFAYFLVCEHYEGWEYSNMLTAKGETTPLYDKVKTVNEELLGLKGAFLDYECKGFMQDNCQNITAALTRAKADYELESFGSVQKLNGENRARTVMGCFENKAGQEAYYVVNADYEHNATVTLTLNRAQSFVIWTKEGARAVENTDTLTLALEAGDGAFIIKFDVNG